MKVVAARTPWAKKIFEEDIESLPGEWIYIEDTPNLLGLLESRSDISRVYFLHWSDRVPSDITEKIECINFHMTDLPFGRGGSPLQNLILNDFEETVLTATQMCDVLDGGPVYLKRRLPLHGTAAAIYARAARLAAQMIEEIEASAIRPVDQEGAPSIFKRRTPAQSRLPGGINLTDFFNFVRMLDAPGYPYAFLIHDSLRIEFRRAVLYADSVIADVVVSEIDQSDT